MGGAIRYRVSVPEQKAQRLRVEAALPAADSSSLELFLPSWTPGSYRIRDHARRIGRIDAQVPGGARIPVRKVSKSRWRLEPGGGVPFQLAYEIDAPELDPCANVVGPSFALIQGAATFLGLRGGEDRVHLVEVAPTESWRNVVTSLEPVEADEPPRIFRAGSYDELIDSPLLLGDPRVRRYEVAGVEHLLASQGAEDTWDLDAAAGALERLTSEIVAFWGMVPYERYVFFNLVGAGFGAIEHRSSSVMLAAPTVTRKRRKLRRWLEMAGHELFHAWNGRHIPTAFRNRAYEGEIYTDELWVAEGITSYYERLLVHRAGLSTRDEFLADLSDLIQGLQETPGRTDQTLEEASFDAWIRFSRPDGDNVNSTVSFYRKGAVLSWLLDAALRIESGGTKSLDDVMRAACRRLGGAGEVEPGAFEALVLELAEGSRRISGVLERGLRTTEELDYSPALDWFGLELGGGEVEPPVPTPWLGIRSKSSEEGRTVVRTILRDSPAHAAGLWAEDEIVGISDRRVPADGVRVLLELHDPGDEVDLLIARRGELLRLPVTLGRRPIAAWRLSVAPDPTPEQREHLDHWLSGRTSIQEGPTTVTGRH